jgi:hypothetical protein
MARRFNLRLHSRRLDTSACNLTVGSDKCIIAPIAVLYSALDCPATETAMMRVTNDTLNLLASMTLSLLLLDVRIGRAAPTAQKMLRINTRRGWPLHGVLNRVAVAVGADMTRSRVM